MLKTLSGIKYIYSVQIFNINVNNLMQNTKHYLCLSTSPERPMRCRYVSAFLGKSKLMTTLTAWMSMPLVNKSVSKAHIHWIRNSKNIILLGKQNIHFIFYGWVYAKEKR